MVRAASRGLTVIPDGAEGVIGEASSKGAAAVKPTTIGHGPESLYNLDPDPEPEGFPPIELNLDQLEDYED